MFLLFIVPTLQHKLSAGSRIRYDRLSETGVELGMTIKVLAMDELNVPDIKACDVCVFSKTYSISAIAVARELQSRGKTIGIDLFDDYFSDADDARLTRFRGWFAIAADSFDFALCSTAAMRDLVARRAPRLPALLLPDAYPRIDPEALARTVSARRERALAGGVLDVAWFGIGANPFFPVGLKDLAAYAWSLGELRPDGLTPRLLVLTDEAAQSARNLARLRQIPIPYRIEPWSLEAEARALEEALVAFIPVNGQAFSRGKSLNRALTALSAGTQILSPGYPLYGALGPAIYRDAGEIAGDIAADRLRIRPETARAVCARVDALAALPAAVADLFVFLVKQKQSTKRRADLAVQTQGEAPPRRRQALVFGSEKTQTIPATGPATWVLSVRAPFSRGDRTFDIWLEDRDGRTFDVWIKPELAPLLAEPLRARCSGPERIGKFHMVRVAADAGDVRKHTPSLSPRHTPQIVYETATYRAAYANVEQVCRRLFPDMRVLCTDHRVYLGCEPGPASPRADVK